MFDSIKGKIVKQITISFAKIGLGSLGTYLVTAGIFTTGQKEELIGVGLQLLALFWSGYDNTQKIKVPKQVTKSKEAVSVINSNTPDNFNLPDPELPPH